MQKKILYTLCSVYRVGNIMRNCGTVSQPGHGHWYHPQTLIRSQQFHIWRRQWHPTLGLLPRKSHGQRRLLGCSPWGREESDMTERRGSLVGCRLWGRTESDTTEATQKQQQQQQFSIYLCVCVCVFVNAQKCSCWILWQICLIVYYQSIFQSGCVILYVQYQCASDQISLHSQQHLVLSPFHF